MDSSLWTKILGVDGVGVEALSYKPHQGVCRVRIPFFLTQVPQPKVENLQISVATVILCQISMCKSNISGKSAWNFGLSKCGIFMTNFSSTDLFGDLFLAKRKFSSYISVAKDRYGFNNHDLTTLYKNIGSAPHSHPRDQTAQWLTVLCKQVRIVILTIRQTTCNIIDGSMHQSDSLSTDVLLRE